MSYKTVLLDLDHTLLDSDASMMMAFADAMATADAEADDHYRHQYKVFDAINEGLWRRVEAGELTPPQVHVRRFEELNAKLGLDADPTAMAEAFSNGMCLHGELYEGALELLDALAPVATLAMVTNGLSKVQRARAERLGISEYFSALIISAEVGTSKPGTAIFDAAFEALGQPERSTALMVGDNAGSDIAGGNAAGVSTCWYNPHGAPSSDQHPATYEISTLLDLVPIVRAP